MIVRGLVIVGLVIVRVSDSDMERVSDSGVSDSEG